MLSQHLIDEFAELVFGPPFCSVWTLDKPEGVPIVMILALLLGVGISSGNSGDDIEPLVKVAFLLVRHLPNSEIFKNQKSSYFVFSFFSKVYDERFQPSKLLILSEPHIWLSLRIL